jgi:hypothetical protein
MKTFEVIFSHPQSPEEGLLCFVEASNVLVAESECTRAVQEPGNVLAGYDFTVWPIPASQESGS